MKAHFIVVVFNMSDVLLTSVNLGKYRGILINNMHLIFICCTMFESLFDVLL